MEPGLEAAIKLLEGLWLKYGRDPSFTEVLDKLRALKEKNDD